MSPYATLILFWIGVPILSIFLGLVALIGSNELATRYPKKLGWTMPGGLVIAFFVVLLAGLGFGFTSATNSFGEPIAIVSPNNSIVALAGQHRDIVWRWDKRLRGNRVINLSPAVYDPISMELQPITTNPKVRPLRYWVRIGAPGTPGARLKFDRKFQHLDPNYGAAEPVENFVKFQLYEFDEHHSKELATLYNPLDEKQQAQLFELLRVSLGSTLEEAGLRVDGSWFDFISVSDLIANSRR